MILTVAVLSASSRSECEVHSIAEAIDSATVLTTFDTEGAEVWHVDPEDSRIGFVLYTGDTTIAKVFDYEGKQIFRQAVRWFRGSGEGGYYSGIAGLDLTSDGEVLITGTVGYEGVVQVVLSLEEGYRFTEARFPITPSLTGNHFFRAFSELEGGDFEILDRVGNRIFERPRERSPSWLACFTTDTTVLALYEDSMFEFSVGSMVAEHGSTIAPWRDSTFKVGRFSQLLFDARLIVLVHDRFVEARDAHQRALWRRNDLGHVCHSAISADGEVVAVHSQDWSRGGSGRLTLLDGSTGRTMQTSLPLPFLNGCSGWGMQYIEAYQGLIAYRNPGAIGWTKLDDRASSTSFFQSSRLDSVLVGPIGIPGLFWQVQKSQSDLRLIRVFPVGEAQLLSIPWRSDW